MATALNTNVKSGEVFISAGILFAVVAFLLYFEASFLSGKWDDIGTSRATNTQAEQENKALEDDQKDIERAKPHIMAAYTRLNDGTLRPSSTRGTTTLPSLADLPLQRAGVQSGTAIPTTGPVFSVQAAARESLPIQLSGLDQAGIVVLSQPAPTDKSDHTRVFDAAGADMEFNRFMPILDTLEKNLPLMVIEEFRAGLPVGVQPFSPKATTLDLRFRLRFPVAESAVTVKAGPKKDLSGAGAAEPTR